MKISINRMLMRNFKGISELLIEFGGKNAYIFGDNETGKTSVSDAFIWCLFDKDSAGRSAFDVKPLDENNEPVHLLETVVELDLMIDDEELRLKKLLKEKWTRKRGDAEDSFTGNETNYWINEVPVKAGEYKAKIAAYLEESTFRQITSAEHFFTMKKPEMRAALVSMIGNISDQMIAGDDKDLIELLQYMQANRYSADDVLKVTRDKVTMINTEIKAIPSRIDEVRRNIPDALNWSEIELEAAAIAAEMAELDKQFMSARAAAEGSRKLEQQRYELIRKADDLKRQLAAEVNEAAYQSEAKLKQIAREIEQKSIELNDFNRLLSWNKEQQTSAKNTIDVLRKLYKENADEQAQIKAEQWQGLSDSDEHCSACGQLLPDDKRENVKALALNAFEASREHQLKRLEAVAHKITSDGKNQRELLDKLAAEQVNIELKLENVTEEIAKLEKQKAMQIEKQAAIVVKQPDDFVNDAAVLAIMAQAEAINSEVDDSEVEQLLEKKSGLQTKLNEVNAQLAKKAIIEQLEKRVDELVSRNRELANELVRFEGIKFNVEKFIRRRGELLEAEINNLFSYIKFRLFKQNINGGIEDDCEALIKGVPYSTNASNSSRIRAGLDIVRTMQKIKGIQSPVFVDNAESATWLLPMDCQIVQLIVSEDDKKLRIELEG